MPSNKKRVYTLQLNPWLRRYRTVVVHNSMGIAESQNECARHVPEGVMVLMADDLQVDPEVQEHFDLPAGCFCMLDTGAFPASGVTIINVRDFWRVGGFNERYRHSVDSEFYARACLKGLRFKPLPPSMVKHGRHESRSSTVYKLFDVLQNRAMFVTEYFRFYPVEVLKHDYVFRLMRGQVRTAVLNALFLFACVVKKWVK